MQIYRARKMDLTWWARLASLQVGPGWALKKVAQIETSQNGSAHLT